MTYSIVSTVGSCKAFKTGLSLEAAILVIREAHEQGLAHYKLVPVLD